jgi:hypothetical protein
LNMTIGLIRLIRLDLITFIRLVAPSSMDPSAMRCSADAVPEHRCS